MLDTNLELSDQLNEFEKKYVTPFIIQRDKMWGDMKTSSTPEGEKQYDRLNYKTVFMQSVVENMRTVLCQDAVLVYNFEKFLQAWEEQKPSLISKSINTLKQIIYEQPKKDRTKEGSEEISKESRTEESSS